MPRRSFYGQTRRKNRKESKKPPKVFRYRILGADLLYLIIEHYDEICQGARRHWAA
jgi:hypothetical protein